MWPQAWRLDVADGIIVLVVLHWDYVDIWTYLLAPGSMAGVVRMLPQSRPPAPIRRE